MNEKYQQDLENLANLGGAVSTYVSVTTSYDCTLYCDGELIGKLAKGEVKKVSVKKGQHIFVFKAKKNPDIFVSKEFECTSIAKTYTLIENELCNLMAEKDAKSNAKRASNKKFFRIAAFFAMAVISLFLIAYIPDLSTSDSKGKAENKTGLKKTPESKYVPLKDAGISLDDFEYNVKATKNGLRGIEITYTQKCRKECNDYIKTIISFYHYDESPYVAQDNEFSYEGNCAIVATDTVSSKKEIISTFIPFISMPQLQKPEGFLENISFAAGVSKYRILCRFSFYDIDDNCIYKTDFKIMDFDKLEDYDQIYGILTIDKVWLEHNVVENGVKGMRIHSKFNVMGRMGQKINCVAYFYDKDKNPLKDTNNKFCSEDGNISTSKKFSPKYQTSYYEDFSFFMPYGELHLTKSHKDLNCKLIYWHMKPNGEYEAMARSERVYFNYSL